MTQFFTIKMIDDATQTALDNLYKKVLNQDESGSYVTDKFQDNFNTMGVQLSDWSKDNSVLANTAALNLATSLSARIDNYISGNGYEIASSVFDIIGALSKFLDLAGPEGAIASDAVKAVCGVISVILGFFGKKSNTSATDMLKEVIKEAIEVQTDENLLAQFEGEMNEMGTCISNLLVWSQYETLQQSVIDNITKQGWAILGDNFMGQLHSYITDYGETTDDTEAQYCVKYLYCYCKLSMLRNVELVLLASLLGQSGQTQIAASIRQTIDNNKRQDKDNLKVYYNEPNGTYNTIMNALYFQLTSDQRGMFETVCNKTGLGDMPGELCRITYNYTDTDGNNNELYMYISTKHSYNGSYWEVLLATYDNIVSDSDSDKIEQNGTLFIMYDRDNDEKVFFNPYGKTYLLTYDSTWHGSTHRILAKRDITTNGNDDTCYNFTMPIETIYSVKQGQAMNWDVNNSYYSYGYQPYTDVVAKEGDGKQFPLQTDINFINWDSKEPIVTSASVDVKLQSKL